MEKENHDARNRVQIPKSAYEGLEVIRLTRVTDMADRHTVLNLAKAWNLHDTADWIESVDIDTYRRVIFPGPDAIGDESLDEKLDRMDREYDEERRGFWEGEESHPP